MVLARFWSGQLGHCNAFIEVAVIVRVQCVGIAQQVFVRHFQSAPIDHRHVDALARGAIPRSVQLEIDLTPSPARCHWFGNNGSFTARCNGPMPDSAAFQTVAPVQA